MDPDVIRNKLESLIRCIQRIQHKTPATLEELQTNLDIQDIIIINLERAIQICVDIGTHLLSDSSTQAPQTMAEVFHTLAQKKIIDPQLANNMANSVGIRNIAVHQYQDINWQIVYAIITKHIDDFKRFSGYIANSSIEK